MNWSRAVSCLASVFVAVGLGVSSADAFAGEYDVVACDAAPSGQNHSWSPINPAPSQVSTFASCPSGGDFSGLVARTVLGVQGPDTGTTAAWRIAAPTGLRISRVRLVRWLGVE